MVGATRVLLILSAAALVQMSWLAAQEGSWTDRLGLRFRDDCQEDVGLTGLLAWVLSWASGRRGQQRNGHCESKEMRCADGTKITGLQVRYARVEASDRDLYDFRPRCGTLWQSWLGMRFPSESDHMQTEGAICPAGSSVTGVQVARGRNERRDWDYYTFKLRCGKHWGEPLGLPFDGLRETRSATCPSGSWTAGLRVHRGFQDWGDLDTYEFQLFCTVPEGRPDKSGKARGGSSGSSGSSSGSSAGGSKSSTGSRKSSSSGSKDSSKGGREPDTRQAERHSQGASAPRATTFGSRAADVDAVAEEVRKELRREALRSVQQEL